MSIWSSVPGPEITALDGHDDRANYRAEGNPSLNIDVATTSFHDHIRISVWASDDAPDVCAVLSPRAARNLRDALDAALVTALNSLTGARTAAASSQRAPVSPTSGARQPAALETAREAASARTGTLTPRGPAGEALPSSRRRSTQVPAEGASSTFAGDAPPAGLLIVVYGLSAPQGSKRARAIYKGRGAAKQFTGKVSVEESSKAVKPWREAVKAAALDLNLGAPLLGPLKVTFTFTFARPKFHYRTGRYAHLLRDNASPYPDVYPDTSKLVRSTEDALTDAGIWRDDAQAVVEVARKVYPGTHPEALDRSGAVIRIQPASPPCLLSNPPEGAH
jgi:Holliday junction resolvase RusA-like endonuclease